MEVTLLNLLACMYLSFPLGIFSVTFSFPPGISTDGHQTRPLEQTTHIYHSLFRGVPVDVSRTSNSIDWANVISSDLENTHQRSEVIQHVKAMEYLFTILGFESRPLSKEMIKKTHEILMRGKEKEDGGGVWAGRYRDDAVRARYKNRKAMPFIHHSAIK